MSLESGDRSLEELRISDFGLRIEEETGGK